MILCSVARGKLLEQSRSREIAPMAHNGQQGEDNISRLKRMNRQDAKNAKRRREKYGMDSEKGYFLSLWFSFFSWRSWCLGGSFLRTCD
jgi:hypothetical protein